MYCRNCGKEISDAAEFCIHCGARPLKGRKYCQNCGSEVNPKAEICVKCGVRLLTEKKKEKEKLKTNIIYCRNCGRELSKEAEICVSCKLNPLSGNIYCLYCGAKGSVNNENICMKCGVQQPPRGKPINVFVWILALLPLGWIFLDMIFKNYMGYLLVCWIINSIFAGLDEWYLNKRGYKIGKIPMLLGFTLVPIYLFIRSKRIDGKYSYSITWVIMFFIHLIATQQKF